MIYSKKIREAAELAYMCHGMQKDKAGYPYIMHPLHLAEQMDDEDSVIVALLHDTVEDCGLSLDDLIGYGFSEVQVAAIRALTHDKGMDYMEYIKKQVKPNPLATKVKIADLKHNMDLSRMDGYAENISIPKRAAMYDAALRRVDKYKKALEVLES